MELPTPITTISNVGMPMTPYEHVRLEGGHQFVAGTIFQGDVHRYIIRKGLVLERLDRLVMLDDFGLFHIFCLDVLL